ncbi:MAG: DUF1836 domain-containing protein [Clostridia bacterium]|nr:DUF1836 domain-containing protein [Clostridia bacterium]
MISSEEIHAYRCPRWDELPDLELYMDQVISVLEKNLKIFIGDDSSKSVTPTMINNYVKQRLVRAPKNKRYDRGHIANLYIITLLKQIMSLSEIGAAITCVTEKYSSKDAYNRFCEIFESSLALVFFEEKPKISKSEYPEADAIIRSITLAYANMLYAGYLVASRLPEKEEVPVKEKKKKEKEK